MGIDKTLPGKRSEQIKANKRSLAGMTFETLPGEQQPGIVIETIIAGLPEPQKMQILDIAEERALSKAVRRIEYMTGQEGLEMEYFASDPANRSAIIERAKLATAPISSKQGTEAREEKPAKASIKFTPDEVNRIKAFDLAKESSKRVPLEAIEVIKEAIRNAEPGVGIPRAAIDPVGSALNYLNNDGKEWLKSESEWSRNRMKPQREVSAPSPLSSLDPEIRAKVDSAIGDAQFAAGLASNTQGHGGPTLPSRSRTGRGV